MVDADGEHREQRARHAEGHRHQVDRERAQERLLAPHEPQPLGDRAADRRALGAVAVRQLRPHPDQREHHREAADGIHAVGDLDAAGGDQQAADRRPEDHRQLVQAEVDGQRRVQPRGLDEVGDDRRARDVLDRAEAGEQAREDVEDAERRRASDRQAAQQRRHRDERDLVEQQQAAAIGAVRERAADERHRHQRPELCRAQEACLQRRVRLHVDLVGQRDERRLRSHAADEVAEHEQAQLARGAQRGQVGGDTREAQALHLRVPAG